MVTAPVSLAYLGSSSQDNLAAQELAKVGMETVITDIQTKRNNNQTVDTSYTYPITSVTMPQDPATLGGATTSMKRTTDFYSNAFICALEIKKRTQP